MGANASWQCCRFREARKCSDDSLSGLTLCDKLISSYPLYAKRHSDELCYYFLDSDPLGEEQTPFGDFDGGYEDCEGCEDRKSTRLNSSHSQISYAVFC